MTQLEEAMDKRKFVHEYTDNMIQMSDIKYIPHYHFENLEWIIADEVKFWLEKHPIKQELTREQCEFILRDICKHVFRELENEKTDFFLYHFPEFVADLYHKINLSWKQ